MIECWHTQLRAVSQHFPDMRLRSRRDRPMFRPGHSGAWAFIHVVPTVAHRTVMCPSHIVEAYKELGYVIIRIEEPRD